MENNCSGDKEMTTYIRLPDQMVLITEEHEITEPVEFELTLKGVIYDSAEFEGKTFWLMVPALNLAELKLKEPTVTG